MVWMVVTMGVGLGVLMAVGGAAAENGSTVVLELPPTEDTPRNSEGAFILLEDGRLLFVYSHFTGDPSDDGTAHLAGRFSNDGGRSWSRNDVVLIPNEGDLNIMSVSLLRLPGGDLGLFYLRKNSKSDCRLYLRRSSDEAGTWGEPTRCIPPVGYYVVNNDRVVLLESGRIIVPAAKHCGPGEEFRVRCDALCFYSDDNGTTWRESDTILTAPEKSKSGLQEPGVMELKDDRLMMWFRTDLGCQMRSFSNDAGETWSDAELTDIASPVSPASIKRVPSTGDLLMVWNDHSAIPERLKGKRTPLITGLSGDEGITWTNRRVLEETETGWYCYTAIAFVDDAVLLAYCAGDTAVEHALSRLRVRRVTRDWLYANQD